MSKFYKLLKSISLIISKLFSWFFIYLKKTFRSINNHTLLAVLVYGMVVFIFYIVALIQLSGDSEYSKIISNTTLNDVTQINPIHVDSIIKPVSINEIVTAINSTVGPISIGGGKFSMGGQTAFENSIHFDMRFFNKVLELDTIRRTITVQPGITWRDIQTVIDPHNLSVKIMQTYANFTVGGSISVNCHGRYIGNGPIVSSVLKMKLITANGQTIEVSRTQNPELFRAIVGGYGGLGVIVEAELALSKNVKVKREVNTIPLSEYNDFFQNNIKGNPKVVFQNGDLYPPNYDEILNISWQKTTNELTSTDRIRPKGESYWLEHKLIEIISWGSAGKWVRKNWVDPILYSPDKVVWRNNEASYDVQELEPSSREKETYVLQEYFIPVKNIESFVPKMREIYKRNNVNVINVSLRHTLPDHETYLSWAREEVFAFVVYYHQNTDENSKAQVKKWTVEMTDAILSENGAWYLPYQPHATLAQFNRGFPNSNSYFEIKNKWDSTNRFTNKLLDKYNPFVQDKIGKQSKSIKDYIRPEEQSILTVPEWYLVFNPKEFADFLEKGENPSRFPYYQSINEFWTLYDRSLILVSEAYPENDEYRLMLQIIGVSITIEYGFKILYENTVGTAFSWFEEEKQSKEEEIIAAANRAYSDFIYHTAWYEFEFYPWVKEIWKGTNSKNGSFLRQWERTILFTVEFSFKAFYAQILEYAATSAYETPSQNICMTIQSEDVIPETLDIQTLYSKGDLYILGLTRWGAFTKGLKFLSDKKIKILDISGNQQIAVSVVKDKKTNFNFLNSELLYQSQVVTNDGLIRELYWVKVNEITSFIKNANQANIEIEHIYDY